MKKKFATHLFVLNLPIAFLFMNFLYGSSISEVMSDEKKNKRKIVIYALDPPYSDDGYNCLKKMMRERFETSITLCEPSDQEKKNFEIFDKSILSYFADHLFQTIAIHNWYGAHQIVDDQKKKNEIIEKKSK